MSEASSPPTSPLAQLALDDSGDSGITELELNQPTSAPHIEAIPLELRFLILSNLEIPDIKQFSLCSRICRTTSLSALYRRLNLTYVYNASIEHAINPMVRLEQIRSAFVDPRGILYKKEHLVRHVTVDSGNICGFNHIVTYFRGWVSLLPLFKNLDSLKILYYSPSAGAYSPTIYEFDHRLFNGTCYRLMETCPAYRNLKYLHMKTTDYRFGDPALSPRPRAAEPLSEEDELFLGLTLGESVLKYSSQDTIQPPEGLEEAYFDIDFRTEPRSDVIDPMVFIKSSTEMLKKLGVWQDLHDARNGRSRPLLTEGIDLTNVKDLGICLDFLNLPVYLTELKARVPNLESLSFYVDQGSEGGFWEEEAIKAYTRVVGAWAGTLTRMRVPWFTVNGRMEGEAERTQRIRSWLDENEYSKLEKVTLVKETPESWFEAVDCSITRLGLGRELKWSQMYVTKKLPLDGL
ncbi:hypothetical protein TWF481_012225 [Arthrobotrys musiformis]|uniref:F-box domain-containing protein n=1 Tax=Arthrobotrys musiformis TaxID=47236 RepID=A0AAV9VYB9_9PEZI